MTRRKLNLDPNLTSNGIRLAPRAHPDANGLTPYGAISLG